MRPAWTQYAVHLLPKVAAGDHQLACREQQRLRAYRRFSSRSRHCSCRTQSGHRSRGQMLSKRALVGSWSL